MDIETRLDRLESRAAIRELHAQYALCMDDQALERIPQIFAPDAVFGYVDGGSETRGVDAIEAMYRTVLANAGPSFHVTHDAIIEFDSSDANAATGIMTCHAETSFGDGHQVVAIRYHDSYHRGPDGWRISARRLGMLYQVPAADYPGILTRKNRRLKDGKMGPAHWPDLSHKSSASGR